MSTNYKNHKLIAIVQEFENTGSRYLINGVDLGKAIFFWRENQRMYDVIPKGAYKITYEGNNVYLDITDLTLLSRKEKIQICYEFASMSSTYEVDFNVDANILKDRYNELVNDVKTLFGYIQDNMMTADGQDVLCVLPELNTAEVWVKTDSGWRGLNIGNLEENIKEMLKQIEDLKKNIFREMLEAKDRHIAEIDGRFDSEVLEGIGRITATSEEKNQSLIGLSIQKEASLTELASQKNSMLEQTFNQKNEALIATGEQKKTEIIQTGNTQVGLVTAEGDRQVKRVTAQGDIEVQRVIDSGVNGKVDKTGDTMTGNLGAPTFTMTDAKGLLSSQLTINNKQVVAANSENNVYFGNPEVDEIHLELQNADSAYVSVKGVPYSIYHEGFKPTYNDVNATGKWEFPTGDAYKKYVVGLVKLTGPNDSSDETFEGCAFAQRENGLVNPNSTLITMCDPHYQDHMVAVSIIGMQNGIKPVKFLYNGQWYGGLEIFPGDSQFRNLFLSGQLNNSNSNSPYCFVYYYDTRTGSVVNSEISNSISFDSTLWQGTPSANNKAIITEYTDRLIHTSNRVFVNANPTYNRDPVISLAIGDNDTGLNWGEDGVIQLWANNQAMGYWNSTMFGFYGNIVADGNIVAYSDIKLKKDLDVIPGALDKIKELSGYTYTRKDSGERQTGVVAQEVQKVLPEAVIVSKDNNGEETLGVAYGNMVGLLIEGIKEQQKKIDCLEERLARLEKLMEGR